MSISNVDLIHLILALFVVMTSSQLFNSLFKKYKQPQVIGEILAGIILGPTLMKHFFPGVFDYIFTDNKVTATTLGVIYQLGLLHLMFCAGMEIKTRIEKTRKESIEVGLITAFGTLIPFAFSFLMLKYIDINEFIGPAHSVSAFVLIFAISIAITSIPVISRILHDLNIIGTAFARIVLSCAVIEDVILYIVLTIALGMVGTSFGGEYGLPVLLGFSHMTMVKLIYHILITFIFIGLSFFIGPRFFRYLGTFEQKYFQPIKLLTFLIVFMLLMSALAIILDLAPMFGAFVAGIVVRHIGPKVKTGEELFVGYSFAIFIPIYFAIVGLRLDLIHNFHLLFFIVFLAFACLIKLISVYFAARISGEKPLTALNLSVAMNARGGPGIVLASLAFDNKIINENFYAILVMLSLVTSFLAGSWLSYVLSKDWSLE